jgi:hypothetical protein
MLRPAWASAGRAPGTERFAPLVGVLFFFFSVVLLNIRVQRLLAGVSLKIVVFTAFVTTCFGCIAVGVRLGLAAPAFCCSCVLVCSLH